MLLLTTKGGFIRFSESHKDSGESGDSPQPLGVWQSKIKEGGIFDKRKGGAGEKGIILGKHSNETLI